MPDYSNELPKECPVTLDHALLHLKSSLWCEMYGDTAQAVHDANMAAMVLATYVWRKDNGR